MSDRPTPWQNFTGQYIAGAWRSGSTRKVLENRNSYDNALLTELSLGDAGDLDDVPGGSNRAKSMGADVT